MNKRYKHIPTGNIYKLNGAGGLIRTDHSTNVLLPLWIKENSKDWEEVKDKPEYTILSYIWGDKNIWKINESTGFYHLSPDNKLFKKYLEKTRDYVIHSVRRESDGEVFTIGDEITSSDWKITPSGKRSDIIESFHPEIDNKNYFIRTKITWQCSLLSCIKVKPKEWEITECQHILHDEDCVPDEYIIKAVKRLSDGVEFKIGDLFRDELYNDFKNNKVVKIREITLLSDNTIELGVDDEYGCDLMNAVKVEKLFTTEDGVDIYEGDKCLCLVDIAFNIAELKDINLKFDYTNDFKYFSTKEAAEDFCLFHKNFLSLHSIKPFVTKKQMEKIVRFFKDGNSLYSQKTE